MNNLFGRFQNENRPQRLTFKILAPALLIFLLALTGFFLYSYLTTQAENKAQASQNGQQLQQVFNAEIQRLSDFALGLALQAATNPDIQEAFANQDRQKLQELTLPGYLALDESFNIPQYQYHLPPATSFLRLHNTANFGDDLSSFRFTVLQVNSTKESVSGLEMGRGGLGLRGIEPVFYHERHIGSVEFGLNIDQTFLANLKNDYGSDWRILVTRESLSLATLEDISALKEGPNSDLLILAETITNVSAPVDVYRQVIKGETVVSQVEDSQGHTYSVITFPLRDYQNSVIGVVEAAIDVTATVQTQSSSFAYFLLALLLALFVGAASLIIITNRTLQPLEVLTNAAQAIQKGDLGQQVKVSSNDEIGTLASAFNSMTSQMSNLINSLEQRVAARTKDLATVAEVGTATATILDTNRLLQTVVNLTKERFDLYHSHIYLLDEMGENLVLAAGAGEPGRQMVAKGHSIPVSREQSLVARAARERQGVTVNDVTQTPDFLPNPLLPDTRSELAVPMIVGENLVGVFDIQSGEVGRFTDSDVNIQTTLASQIATSIQNVRLFEKSKAEADLETLANTIGRKIQQTTTMEDVLQTAIRELGSAIGAPRVKVNLSVQPDGKEPSQ
ncbi:MAG: cache domain-containing protein [Chloroflexota bacterium]